MQRVCLFGLSFDCLIEEVEIHALLSGVGHQEALGIVAIDCLI
jgi:hypothetical protein